MENIRNLLDQKLLTQPFKSTSDISLILENARTITRLYTAIENGVGVLSDLKARKSYIYYGPIAATLGLQEKEYVIDSIWEDELLGLIHSEDIQKKYRLELRFFQQLNAIDPSERSDYQVITKLRIRDRDGKFFFLKHRLLYICSADDGTIWLALCLYSNIYDYPGFDAPDGLIINTRTGIVFDSGQDNFSEILSIREKEIVRLIKQGKRSKEIADLLLLSIHTVNRHRQNIFKKLNVSNAMEACRVAEATGLIQT